ncbi:MAG: spore coat protein U domain-containing protein [Burkholderiaceae bacterium]|nr:spore coat protein U domain-containing protein [Burkholderiaceae bacterium]
MFFKKSLLALGLTFAAAGAFAQTTGNINVSATVQAACTIATNPLAFGNYNPLSGSALQSNTTMDVTCSVGSVPTVSLGAGNNVLGNQRRMANGTERLNYSLNQPSANTPGAGCAYTTSWGDGTVAGSALALTAATSLAARTYNVCGEIPAGQSAATGSYTDVVVATVSF